jgi:type VI secretion system secreted protein Hcp
VAFQTFMKIEGVSGESVDSDHIDWIEVLGMNWEMTSAKDLGGTDTSGAGRTHFSDFSISKAVDVSSPLLLQQASNKRKIPQIKIEVCRAAGIDKMRYLEYTFTNCVITRIQLNAGGASGGIEALPFEEVAFNYDKFDVTYTLQRRADGSPAGVTKASFDLSGK